MTSPRSPRVHVTRGTRAPSAAYLAMVAPLLIDSSSGCACTRRRRRAGCSVMAPPYEEPPTVPLSRVAAVRSELDTADHARDVRRQLTDRRGDRGSGEIEAEQDAHD